MALSTNNVVIARLAAGMYGMQLGWNTMNTAENDSDGTDAGLKALMNTLYGRDFAFASDADVASALAANLGMTGADATDAAAYIEGQLGAAAAGQKGAAVVDLVNLFAGLTGDARWGGYATAFNTQIARAVAYAEQQRARRDGLGRRADLHADRRHCGRCRRDAPDRQHGRPHRLHEPGQPGPRS